MRGLGDRRVHAHAQHIAEDAGLGGRLAHHVADAAEILVEEDLLAQAVHAPRVLEELEVALAGLHRGELSVEVAREILGIVAEIKHRAVFVEAAPLRVEAHEIEVVGHAPSAAADDAAHDLGHGDDGRPHVEGVALLGEDIHLAAEMAVLLDDGDIAVAAELGGEFGRCREAGKSAADDDDALLHACTFSEAGFAALAWGSAVADCA